MLTATCCLHAFVIGVSNKGTWLYITYFCPSSNMDYKGKYGYLLVQKNTRMQYIGCKICAK
jgi:hypothetical protein